GSVVSSLHCMNDPQPEGHMASHIGRRKFLTALGGAAAAWQLAASARQPAMPVVGFVNSRGASVDADGLVALRQGMKDTGYVEGQNVVVEYRFAQNQYDRLPVLAADLVRRQVAVIVANTPAALPAKAATTTIPIVFLTSVDPVEMKLIASLNRPGGNLTGVRAGRGDWAEAAAAAA